MKRKKCACCEIYTNNYNIHHILPISLGGVDSKSNRVTICVECHGKIHNRSSISSSSLIREGLRIAKERGQKFGAPRKVNWDKILELRKIGYSLREIALEVGTTKSTVSKVLKSLKQKGLYE